MCSAVHQDDLFSAPPVQHNHPNTSRQAAVIASASAGALRDRILLHLLRVGDFGTTAYEAWKACGGKYPHVAGTRLNELEKPKDGVPLVEPTDRRRLTDSNTPAVVWCLTRAGQARAVELRRDALATDVKVIGGLVPVTRDILEDAPRD